jgi:hypothetical protein
VLISLALVVACTVAGMADRSATATSAAEPLSPPALTVALHSAHAKPAQAKATQAVTDTTGLSEVVQSPSGQTVVLVQPLVVSTGGELVLHIRSRRLARVVATLTYPDGQTAEQQGKIGPAGTLVMGIRVLYVPVDRSALASLSVAVSRGAAFSESVTAPFTVLRQSTLAASVLIVRPLTVRTGQTLYVLVHSLPYVQVHISVTDPSGQTISTDGSTAATGFFTTTVPVSYNPNGQASAAISVTALLSYEGQTRLLGQRVPLLQQ